MGEDLDIFN